MGAISTSAPTAWWKADTLGLGDGAAVASITDATGNGWTASQGTSGNRPTFRTGVSPTGLGAMSFDGSNDYLSTSLTGSTGTTTHVAVVWIYPGTTTARTVIGSAANSDLHWYVNSTHKPELTKQGVALIGTATAALPQPANATDYSAGKWAVIFVENVGATSYRFERDGAADNNGTHSVSLTGGAAVSIGAAGAGLFAYHGFIGELVRWHRTLTGTERADVAAELRAKWITASAVSVAAPALAVSIAAPVPTVTAGAAATVGAPALALSLTLPVPAVSAGTGVVVSAPTLAVSVAVPAPTVEIATSVTVAAPALGLSTTVPAPTVTAGSTAAVTAPALALTFAVPAPVVDTAGDGVIEVTIDCGVIVGPLSVEIGGATGVEDVVTVNIDCGVDLTPYVLLRPVAPPLGVITEWPIERHAHLMAALSAANPTYSGGIDYVIEREETGRPHVFVGGVDVTFKDGCPAFFEDWSSSVPLGPESARIAMPQMKPWHEPGVDSWSMFAADAPVEIAMIRPDDTVEPLWEGFLAVEGDTSGQSGEDYVFTADGLMMQAAHELHDPPIVMPPTDYGHLIADTLNSVTHRRWTKIPRFTTGHTTSYRGEQSQTKLQYVNDLLARCFHDDGRQLTLARVAAYTYRIQWKKAQDADADWTVTKGAPGIAVSLERNHAARVDAIYGRGYDVDGGFWCGRVFPGLDAGVPPVYPMGGFANISVGTTDSDTATGNGVTTWQRQMRELGYPVTVDGVMNSADTEWVRKVQRDSGSTVDGSLGPQTWAATWENNSTAGDFTSYRLPLATRSAVEPFLYGGNGAIIGANPADDPSIVRHAIEVDFKTNIAKSTATALSQAMLDRLSDVGYQGTITLLTDPHEAGSSRFDIRAGDNIHVIGHHGGVTVQVSEVSASGLEVRLTVDSLARDAEIVANLLDRAEEARRDLAGRTGGSDASRLNNGRTVPYESESKAGRIARTAVNGNSGLWTIRKAFVSQVGVAKIEFSTSPNAENVTAIFNRPITANRIAALVPDPLADSSGWYDAVETLKESYGCMEVFGTPENSGGYWPRQEGEGPLTGKQRDSASTLYDSPYGGFVWVAMFTSRSCWVEGTVFPAVPN